MVICDNNLSVLDVMHLPLAHVFLVLMLPCSPRFLLALFIQMIQIPKHLIYMINTPAFAQAEAAASTATHPHNANMVMAARLEAMANEMVAQAVARAQELTNLAAHLRSQTR